MKKYLLWSALLLMAGAVATSCSKDNTDGPGPEGGEAKITFTLKLPPAAVQSRAGGMHATLTEENDIQDVVIYVFDNSGAPANDASGGIFKLTMSTDFTPAANNTYTMNNPVTTTAGVKKIYVVGNQAVNGITPDFVSENDLLTRIAAVNGELIDFASANVVNTIIFVGSETETLPATTGGPAYEVTIDIERSISRVIATSPATYPATWKTSGDMTWAIKKFFVTQDAYKSYFGPNFIGTRAKTLITATANRASVLNLYNPADYSVASPIPYIDIVPDAAPGSTQEQDRAAIERFYIGENAPNDADNEALKGNTTYAWIQTYASISKTAQLNGAGDDIEYEGPAITGGTDDLHLVRVVGVNDYICAAANSGAVVTHLEEIYTGQDQVQLYTYPKAYVYYRVYLNKTDDTGTNIAPDDKYNVYRNQFIHMDIAGVKVDINKPGGFGDGYPGDPGNPEIPIDPEDGNNGNNPGPVTPTEPIDELESSLKVNINVNEWTYSQNKIYLE